MLMAVSEIGEEQDVHFLLSRGAAVDHRHAAGFGDTALTFAAENNRSGVIGILCAYNASINLQNTDGNSQHCVDQVLLRGLCEGLRKQHYRAGRAHEHPGGAQEGMSGGARESGES